MRVFDFDGTIYDGESSVDFFLFSLKRHPKNLLLLPRVFYMLLRYKRLKITPDELAAGLEKYGARFLSGINDLSGDIVKFWDGHFHKIKQFYLEGKLDDDVILSASPDFLIVEAAKRLGIKTVIASSFDLEKGKILRLCYHENKCEYFSLQFPDKRIDEFYTDSDNDKAVFKLSDRVFMVKGNKITERK
ncbi:MAG: haloacid dehalogenase-like hydrolase [Clostridia bacterium]|nr:haloacid dehalogenase-like hydrolase [Clostridia bacterium]